MTKRKIYRVLQIILVLPMLLPALGKLTQSPEALQSLNDLGYPSYLGNFLGIAYLLGVVAIVQPMQLFFKEWAYAGFVFAFLGASVSHWLVGDPVQKILPALVFLALTLGSYFFEKTLQTSG